MKRGIMILLALVMLLSLAACGKGEPVKENDKAPAATETVETPEADAPYVEEVPAANVLDDKNPIPADTGTLELTPVTFADANLTLNLPEGVSAKEVPGTDNNARICVSSEDGVWKIWFEPYKDGRNLLSFVTTTMIYAGDSIKQDWSQDVPTQLGGFPARVWANNILPGWLYPENRQDTPAVDVILDYGETLVGPWYGMQIRLEAQNPTYETNIYELLYLRHVRAVLQNFEVLTTPDGITKSAGGITVTFPARWNILQSDNGFVTSFHSEELTGGINFGTSISGDPAEVASWWEGEAFTETVGGRKFHCVIQENAEDPDNVYYNMKMFSDYSDSRCLNLSVNLRGYGPMEYKAFLKNDIFVDVLETMEIDPNGYRKPGTAEADGFETDRGIICSYTGGESQLEIPSEIGGMETTAIGRGTFADNTEITSVVIPEGVTTIEGIAFMGCTNLETVVFPSTLMEIGLYAFADCVSLKNVVLPDGVVYVGGAAFSGAGTGSFSGPGAEYAYSCFDSSGFDTITIGAGADLSGDYMFAASAVSAVNLPMDLEVLGQGAFSGCANLDELALPDSVREVGPNCFTNMGYLQITLSDSLEYIPDSCFSSTNLDVLVVPESVQRIESYAIYDAAYMVLTNPAVELYGNAINCDYLCIEDAVNFVFPDEMVFWVQRLYLDGIYDPAQIQGNLGAQYINSQVYLPMDATLEETAAMDNYLLSIGLSDIAWIGTPADFLPERTQDYTVDVGAYTATAFAGGGALATIPEYVMIHDDPFWYTAAVEGVAEKVFAGTGVTVAYFRCSLWSGVGAKVLSGCDNLKDIWFSSAIMEELAYGNYHEQAFVGIPDGVVVHLPASLTEEQLATVKDGLAACGLPATAVFETYSLR